MGYSYSSTGDVEIERDATIKLTENPTTLYAIWGASYWEVSNDTLTFYGPYVMDNYGSSYYTPWVQYANDIKTIIINEGMKAIGNGAFNDFHNLTSVSLPSSLTSIGERSFHYCPALTTIEIPSNVTEIKQYAFIGSGLTSIDIPASVTAIGMFAFRDCSNLSSVTVRATTPPKLGWDVFDFNAAGRKIYVPYDALDDYKGAAEWCLYANDILPINEEPSGGGTGIESMEDVRSQMEDVYYTIDGRKVDSKPTQRGIYIKNGKKIVVK